MTGGIVWFTGLPGSGKTTLARLLAARAQERQQPVEVLDGDELRQRLSKDLGFSKADRNAHADRVAFAARRLARQGVLAIVATISPYESARVDARGLAAAAGIPFALVFLDAHLDTLIARDVKGHYRKAVAGELPNFTGVSDPFERPLDADIVVNTEAESERASADRIAACLLERGILRA